MDSQIVSGISFADASSVLAVLSAYSITNSEASMALKSMLANIAHATPAATEALGGLGVFLNDQEGEEIKHDK